MPLIFSGTELIACCLAMRYLLVSPSCISLRSFARLFFLIKEAVFLVRRSQPQPHHGRFDASFLYSRMLTFSEWRMAEQLLSRRGIIQKAKRHPQPADSVPAAPTCVASSCALVLRYDTAAWSVAVSLRLGWWILLFASCLLHACNPVRLLVKVLARHEDAILLMRPPTACISWCGHRENVEQEGRLVRARCWGLECCALTV